MPRIRPINRGLTIFANGNTNSESWHAPWLSRRDSVSVDAQRHLRVRGQFLNDLGRYFLGRRDLRTPFHPLPHGTRGIQNEFQLQRAELISTPDDLELA